ncbi:AfsR/SARP family transcriptional regulator [Gloeobacter morelensis]|uniref:AAA family ATPase n=1 Tax=Gloeobacter morelensis MG652769 TaxID=2781736 RepID=A0ABY3PIH8_9CYAN|nr:BTAD domain-containing putative transcriptional regulator [Gloeobacter morelensis]UFP93455.1 AAA family ATPase [Gloeobacter morelensis MG652769]
MARLAISLLGPFEATLDGRPSPPFAYEKVRLLLAYLVVEARYVHHRETLAALLWPDQPGAVARGNLRKALLSLRQVLGDHLAQVPFLIATRNTIQFNRAGDYTLDTVAFTAQLDAYAQRHPAGDSLCTQCLPLLEQAVALYRGPFLGEANLPGCEAFEEWAVPIREQLHLQAVNACSAITAYYEQQRHWEQVQRYAWRQLTLEPWNENAHCALMRALAHSGQRGAALQQYERCRKVLAEALGVLEAEPATTALYEQIRSGALGLPEPAVLTSSAPGRREVPGPGNLPAPLTGLVGREREILAAGALLARAAVRLVSFTGVGGTGKTRLALAVAQARREDFADGVWFVELAALNNAALLPVAIAQALAVQESGAGTLLQRLAAYLKERQILLVLDNFEHIAEAARSVGELLAACPQLKILITSRTRLHLYGEWEFDVPPLTVPTSEGPLTYERICASEAVQLFAARAEAARRDFVLTPAVAPAVAAICTHLDGLPLAIELAAARSARLDPPALLEQLDKRLSLLVDGPANVPDRHRTLRQAIAWSYNLLPRTERQLFRRLGVFAGGWSVEAALAVCGEPDDTGRDMAAKLLSLAHHHLLKQETVGQEETRYTMLATLREYALAEMEAADEQRAVHQRHSEYFLQWATASAAHLRGAQQGKWYRRFGVEHENLRAALHWTFAHGRVEAAARLATALCRFWWFCGHLSEGRRWHETVLAQREHLSGPILARLLAGAGMLALRQGDAAQAAAWYSQSERLCLELQDSAGLAVAAAGLGMATYYGQEHAAAQAHFETSLVHEREHGLPLPEVALARFLLAAVQFYTGSPARAHTVLSEALEHSRTLGEPFVTALCLAGLGQIALATGEYSHAEQQYSEALALLEELDARESSVSWVLGGLAALAAVQGQSMRSVRLYAAAEALSEAYGSPLGPEVHRFHEPFITSARTHLGEAAFASTWLEGRALTRAAAFALARHDVAGVEAQEN